MENLKIEIKSMRQTKENIIEFEKLRYDAICQNISEQYLTSSKVAARIYDAELMIFGLYLDDILAAGCYISDSFGTLFIDQLFVKKEFQETGLYLGRTLLKYLLENRTEIEEFFHFHPKQSKLFFLDSKSKNTYDKLGYTMENSEIGLMSKKLN